MGRKLVSVFLVAVALLVSVKDATSAPGTPSKDFVPSPKSDSRGFIDVWQLRDDVTQVEALLASDDTDGCYPEGDPDEKPPTAKEAKRRALVEKECVDRVTQAAAAYKQRLEAFNRAWLPVMHDAIRRGDRVAEVIMRQCETTPVLDRKGIEATCDEGNRSRVALRRLEEIGFVPALGLPERIVSWQHSPAQRRARDENQNVALRGISHGVLGFDFMDVSMGGNVANDSLDWEAYQRWAVIEAAIQEAPRAFTFTPHSNSAGWATGAFAQLRLNRKPLTPGYLTWGRALHYGGSNSPWTGPNYWRSSPKRVWGKRDGERAVSGKAVPAFQASLREILAKAEANIERYLKEDPRWGVFLLRRVGHHEWVPEGMRSTTQELASEWEGTWILEKETDNWTTAMTPRLAGRATIKRSGEFTQMTVRVPHATTPFQDVTDCTLRYSGGLTYYPQMTPNGQAATATTLGYFYAAGSAPSGGFFPDGQIQEAVAPFAPKKRFKQVLMQCEGAESADSDRLRFLLLAGDTLVEVGAEAPFGAKLAVRHYRRWTAEAAAAEIAANAPVPPTAADARMLQGAIDGERIGVSWSSAPGSIQGTDVYTFVGR